MAPRSPPLSDVLTRVGIVRELAQLFDEVAASDRPARSKRPHAPIQR